MSNSLTLPAYAKINLYLDVVGKRSDGYHSICSVMQSISLHDTVTVSKNNLNTITVTCDDDSIPCDETNIAVKAAQEFFNETKCFCGVDIDIAKRIPSQAGLGGGSADGAVVISALNEIFMTGLNVSQLCDIGSRVGADIPFCLMGGTVLCEGIGEILTPLNPIPDCYIVIAKGTEGISTNQAYQKIDMLPERDSNNLNIRQIFNNNDITKICPACYNVFEKVSSVGEIAYIKQTMRSSGALVSCMSGSGSAVFGIFEDRTSAAKCAKRLMARDYYYEICTPVNSL